MHLPFHLEARAEFLAAADWHERERPGLGLDFIEHVDRAVDTIAAHPEAWPAIAREGDATLRRFVLPRFPYSVIYAVRGGDLFVLAVAHDKRRPGYWRDRIRSGA